jgi:hypothetical protein
MDFGLAGFLAWLLWMAEAGLSSEDCTHSSSCPAHLY